MRSASGRLMPSTLAMSSIAAAWTPRRPPKCSSSAWRRLAPMPGISFSIEVVRVLPRRARCPAIAKRCASSRICWIEMQRRDAPARAAAAARLGLDDQLLHARLALRALGHADDAHLVQAQISQALRDATLTWPLPPSIRTRSGILPLSARRRAGSGAQHLAHRRVVVARRDAADVEAPVLGLLHLLRGRRPRTRRRSPRPSCG